MGVGDDMTGDLVAPSFVFTGGRMTIHNARYKNSLTYGTQIPGLHPLPESDITCTTPRTRQARRGQCIAPFVLCGMTSPRFGANFGQH